MIRNKYVGLLVIVLVQSIYAMNDQLNKVNRAASPAQKRSLKASSDKISSLPTPAIQIVVSAVVKANKLSESSESIKNATIRDYASFPHSHNNSPEEKTFGLDDSKHSSPQSFHHSFYGNYGNDD